MISRRTLIVSALAVPVGGLAPRIAMATTPRVYAEGGIAIDGTDPVAYFTDGRPTAGQDDLTVDWMGASWRFSTKANRAAFAANPEAYAPQFAGYCAWAVSRGYTASTVPEAWTIHEGRLYLNFSRRIRRRWERDIPGNIARGEANWPGVLNG